MDTETPSGVKEFPAVTSTINGLRLSSSSKFTSPVKGGILWFSLSYEIFVSYCRYEDPQLNIISTEELDKYVSEDSNTHNYIRMQLV